MKRFTPLLLFFLLLGFAAQAQAADTDRDGLSNKREKKIRTNPRKADTDSDKLRDGREVKKTKTSPRKFDTDSDSLGDGAEVADGLNPLNPDSDGDGARDIYERKGKITKIFFAEGSDPLLTVQTKRKTIFQVRVDEGTFLEGLDRNGDEMLTLEDFQVGDAVEVNLDPDDLKRAQTLELRAAEENKLKGEIVSVEDPMVSVRSRDGEEKTFAVDVDTLLRAPDRDGSGAPSIGDLEPGDRVRVLLSEDGSRALALKVEYDEEDYGEDDGYPDKPEESLEAEGRVQSVNGSALTLERRGYTRTISVDAETFLFGPDRDQNGKPELADIRVGDEVEARLRPGTDIAGGLRFKGEEEEDRPPLPPGETLKELEGPVVGILPGSAEMPPKLLVAKPIGPPLYFKVIPETTFDVPDRNGDGQRKLDDLLVGDRVKVKFASPSLVLLQVQLEDSLEEED